MDWPNRTACDVLQEMRGCFKTRNFAGLMGMVEELQSICKRMEAGLGDKRDVQSYTKERSDLRKEVKKLALEVEEKKAKLKEE